MRLTPSAWDDMTPVQYGMAQRRLRQGHADTIDVPSPPAATSWSIPTWVFPVAGLTLIVLQQIGIALGRLPQSSSITIALVIVSTLIAIIEAGQQFLAQYTAHRVAMARITLAQRGVSL